MKSRTTSVGKIGRYNKWLKQEYAHNSGSERRSLLGERELVTFEILFRAGGYPEITGIDRNGNAWIPILVDAGCGDRYLESAVTNRALKYIGLDVDDVDFETGSWPIENEGADIVVSLAVLEHLHDPSQFLQEIRRVLRPRGVLILSTPNWRYSASIFYNDPTHVQPYTSIAVERLLTIHGFEKISTFPGARCKPSWFYKGSQRFRKCYFLLPFRGDTKWAPRLLRGHARSLFAVAIST